MPSVPAKPESKTGRNIFIAIFLVILVVVALSYGAYQVTKPPITTPFPTSTITTLGTATETTINPPLISGPSLEILGPSYADVGDRVVFTIVSNGQPVIQADVEADGIIKVTDGTGSVSFLFEWIGVHELFASKPSYQGGLKIVTIYPRGNGAIPIRGAIWSLAPIKETPYAIRMAGANYVDVKAIYMLDDEANLTPTVFVTGGHQPGKETDLMDQIANWIGHLRSVGLNISLTIWVSYEREIPEPYVKKFTNQISYAATRWAEFAAKHNVEIYVPMVQLYSNIGWKRSSDWYQSMLPVLRERYHGILVIGWIPFLSDFFLLPQTDPNNLRNLDFNFSGYSAGLDYYAQHASSWNQLEKAIDLSLDYADSIRRRYGSGIFIGRLGPIGVDAQGLLQGYENEPWKAKTRFWNMVMEKSVGRVDGIFFVYWEYSRSTINGVMKDGESKYEYVWQGKESYETMRAWFTSSLGNVEKKCAFQNLKKAESILLILQAEGGALMNISWIKKMVEEAKKAFNEGNYIRAISVSKHIMAETYKLIDNPYRISIDGRKDDWINFIPLCTKSAGNIPGGHPFNTTAYPITSEYLSMDIKCFYALSDQKMLYVVTEFYSDRPTLELKILLDVDDDGRPDYQILAHSDHGAFTDLETIEYLNSQIVHRKVGKVPFGYERSIEVGIPLELIGNPKAIRTTVESIDQKNGISLDVCGDEILEIE